MICSEGKLAEATENYKEFVKISEEVGDKTVHSQACSSLASLYNMLVSGKPKFHRLSRRPILIIKEMDLQCCYYYKL